MDIGAVMPIRAGVHLSPGVGWSALRRRRQWGQTQPRSTARSRSARRPTAPDYPALTNGDVCYDTTSGYFRMYSGGWRSVPLVATLPLSITGQTSRCPYPHL